VDTTDAAPSPTSRNLVGVAAKQFLTLTLGKEAHEEGAVTALHAIVGRTQLCSLDAR
jgi:hypothetical protein